MYGSLLALLCAITWSLAVILLKISGARMHPYTLNFVKNILGLPLLLLTAFLVEGGLQWPQDTHHLVLLFVSGAMGIGLADALVLKSMKFLRASHIAVLECLFSPFVIIISVIWFDERPSVLMLTGGLFIIASLFFLKPEKEVDEKSVTRGMLIRGGLLMAAGLFTMAVGIVMVKPVFNTVPLISLVSFRMMAGVVASSVLFATVPNKRSELRAAFVKDRLPQMLAACFFSSYLSIILWIAGYKYLQATVAALLNQTSTIFTVLLAVIFLREKLTKDKVLATVSAVIGVVLLTLA